MFRSLALSLLAACVVALFVACGGGPPAKPAPPPTISLSDLRDQRKEREGQALRISGRARVLVTPAFDGAVLVFVTADPNLAYGIALLRNDLNKSGVVPALHGGHDFDVTLDGLVTTFEGGQLGAPEFGFAFMVVDVIEAKHVGK